MSSVWWAPESPYGPAPGFSGDAPDTGMADAEMADAAMPDIRLGDVPGLEAVNREALADLLSACLAHERAEVLAFRTALAYATEDASSERFEALGSRAEDRVRVLVDLIEKLGGDPMYVGSVARVEERRGARLLELALEAENDDSRLPDPVLLQTVVLVEIGDRNYRRVLEKVAEQLPDSPAMAAIRSAVAALESEEGDDLRWARSAWEQAWLLRVKQR